MDLTIDISFFKNHKFLSALFVEFSLYFSFLILSFTFGFVLNTVYGIELSRVSWVLFPSFIAATFMGMVSGKIKDRKSTRLNSSHVSISYAVFCLKKK